MRMICCLPGVFLIMTLLGASPYEGGIPPDPNLKINAILRSGWKEKNIAPPETASDAVFLRRVYLTVAGRLPTIAEARRFLADKSQDKRAKLIDSLLASPEYADLLARDSIILGRTTITNSMAPGTKDCSPIPSDSACIQHRRFLTADLSATDTMIYIDDPTYLEEIACWEGHCPELNMVKIGKELIHYLGVSKTAPYRLLNVTRGYWGSKATPHAANDTVYKLQVTINYGYEGIIPNWALQEKIAELYAEICHVNGLGYYDFDGQEFLFNNGHGYYSAKRFFRRMFEHAAELGVPYIRFTGATLSEG